MNCRVIFFSSHHCWSLCEINSGPLSVRMFAGFSLWISKRSSTRMTLKDGSELSTSIANDSRLKSSMTFKSRNFLPSTKLSLMKSMLHTWLGAVGAPNGCFILSGNLFLALLRIFSFISRQMRRTRLWFHFSPWFLSRWYDCQKPMVGCLLTNAVKASWMTLSSFDLWVYW